MIWSVLRELLREITTRKLLDCVFGIYRAASDLIEELLDSKRYNSRARPQADSSTLQCNVFV